MTLSAEQFRELAEKSTNGIQKEMKLKEKREDKYFEKIGNMIEKYPIGHSRIIRG